MRQPVKKLIAPPGKAGVKDAAKQDAQDHDDGVQPQCCNKLPGDPAGQPAYQPWAGLIFRPQWYNLPPIPS